jgi:DNA invertase Pin-like site-specific DNA recombinase
VNEQRAALYLRVSTGRQAEHDLSIPDQRRQLEAYCRDKGWRIVAEYVEPGASATDDRRPEFQRMMEAATEKPPAFDVIVVHSFSRFFRDHFELEFYVRRLNKHGVKLVSAPRSSATTRPACSCARSWRYSTSTSRARTPSTCCAR